MNKIAIHTPTREHWTAVSDSLGYMPWAYPSRWEDNRAETVIYAAATPAYGAVRTARRKGYQIVEAAVWLTMTDRQRIDLLTREKPTINTDMKDTRISISTWLVREFHMTYGWARCASIAIRLGAIMIGMAWAWHHLQTISR